MADGSLSGMHPNCGTRRMVSYMVWFTVAGDALTWTALFRDEVGVCGEDDGELPLKGRDPREAVHAEMRHYLDVMPLEPGRPAHQGWVRFLMNGGHL